MARGQAEMIDRQKVDVARISGQLAEERDRRERAEAAVVEFVDANRQLQKEIQMLMSPENTQMLGHSRPHSRDCVKPTENAQRHSSSGVISLCEEFSPDSKLALKNPSPEHNSQGGLVQAQSGLLSRADVAAMAKTNGGTDNHTKAPVSREKPRHLSLIELANSDATSPNAYEASLEECRREPAAKAGHDVVSIKNDSSAPKMCRNGSSGVGTMTTMKHASLRIALGRMVRALSPSDTSAMNEVSDSQAAKAKQEAEKQGKAYDNSVTSLIDTT